MAQWHVILENLYLRITISHLSSIPLFLYFSLSLFLSHHVFFKIKFIIIIFLIQALLNKGIFCFLLLQNCSNFYCQQISSSTGLIL